MITVPQATEKIIKRSRFLTEAMSKGLINYSSLARQIQAEIEEITMKKVTRASIVMAIKRYAQTLRVDGAPSPLLSDAPDMIVRSNLSIFFVTNSPTLLPKLVAMEQVSQDQHKRALFSYGRAETVILANKRTSESVIAILENELITQSYHDVSSITIHIPVNAVITPGILNLFIKSLSFEYISILSLFVSGSELTLVFQKDDVHTAFGILRSLFI